MLMAQCGVGEASPGQTDSKGGWPLLFFPFLDVAQCPSAVAASLGAARVRATLTNQAHEGKPAHLLFPARVAVSTPLTEHLVLQHPRGAHLSLSFLLTVVSC